MSCEKECKLGKTYCCMECPSYDICREKRKNRKSSFEKAVKWIAVNQDDGIGMVPVGVCFADTGRLGGIAWRD